MTTKKNIWFFKNYPQRNNYINNKNNSNTYINNFYDKILYTLKLSYKINYVISLIKSIKPSSKKILLENHNIKIVSTGTCFPV